MFPLAALLGAAVVVLPAVAGSETSPTIKAENYGGGIYGETHAWSPAQATIAPGGAVMLSNPTAVSHGVHWVYGPATPSCTGGVPVEAASGKEWSGTCTFTTAGVYTFYCTVHGAEMTGTISVGSTGTTTITTTTQPAATGPGPSTSAPSTPSDSGSAGALGSPLVGSAAKAIKLASSQHGKAVRGSVMVSAAGAGGRLEIDLLAKSASLASAGHSAAHTTLVRVGRVVRSSLSAGAVSFSVPLGSRAKSRLKRKGRLALTVRLVLKPLSGAAVTAVRGVVVHP